MLVFPARDVMTRAEDLKQQARKMVMVSSLIADTNTANVATPLQSEGATFPVYEVNWLKQDLLS